jgi:hypothetical protein
VHFVWLLKFSEKKGHGDNVCRWSLHKQSMFGTSTGATGGFGSMGGFGSSAAPSTSLGFGSTAAAAPAANTQNAFGTTAPASGGFGSSAPTTGGFGSAPASGGFGSSTSATGGFGSAPASGGFGSSTSATGGFGSAPATGGFGIAPASGAFGTGGFGSLATPTTGMSSFGTGGFGQAASGTKSMASSFGQPSASANTQPNQFSQQQQQQQSQGSSNGKIAKCIEKLQLAYAPYLDSTGRPCGLARAVRFNEDCYFKTVLYDKKTGPTQPSDPFLTGSVLEQVSVLVCP